MPDPVFKTYNVRFNSRGVVARYVDDSAPNESLLNENNCEELAEGAIGQRLGTTIINKSGTTVYPLAGSVHSVSKLNGLSGAAWRYAGAGQYLYRITGLSTGAYTQISSSMSGSPWQAVAYQPTDITSYPYLFIADAAQMKKDNGTFSAPQQMGIFQPQYPVQAQAQDPDEIILDAFQSSAYTTSNISSFSDNYVLVSTNTSNAVTSTGIQTVNVSTTPNPIGLFQSVVVDTGGNAETVLVIAVTSTGFTAKFTKLHASGVTVEMYGWSGTVQPSTVGTVTHSFGGTPVTAWPTTLQQEDYIGLYIYVSDPTQVQSIQLSFDCGNGTFESDYFYKVIAQGPLQSLLNTAANNSTEATTAATDALLDQTLGLYGNSSSSIAQLSTGQNNWTPLLIQLSDFAGAGRANFSDPVYNWSNINGYQITITMNDNTTALIEAGSLILFGGAGPDSFAGVSYDWLFTFYNNVDGTESNPCMVMTNVNPPTTTYFITPRRQPVLLTLIHPTLDPQTTSLRVYRRGGTLGDNYRRVQQIDGISGFSTQYTDISSDEDIQANDIISFTNDVPVTSSLVTPVNTTLEDAIISVPGVQTITPVSMANISLSQQVTIGVIGGPLNNTETVIVLSMTATTFTAYVQSTHSVGEPVTATAKYGQPVTIMTQAFGQMWFAGDPNNPSYLYWSAASNPQAVSSAAYVAVGTPDDPITAIIQFKGNLYVSTHKFWYAVAPGSNANQNPTIYPTAAKHGCVAPLGYIVTEEAIYFQAIDGLRVFSGGAADYLSQDIEFIFQGIGTTPIVQAATSDLQYTRAAYWCNMLFFSYIGVDGNRHRIIWHTIYKRYRNDDLPAESLFLEAETNTLVFGDPNGLVRLDRQNVTYDERNAGGVVDQVAIGMNVQSPYNDQGLPAEQKQYQEFTLDANTGGLPVTVTLQFNDGEFEEIIGTITTTERQRVNLALNNGDGYEAYKVSLQLTADASDPIYLYQAAIRALQLAKTRTSYDSFECRFGIETSKLAKNLMLEYTATEPISGTIIYDDPCWPNFTFTLPANGGVRNPLRLRLPAVKFRFLRCIMTSTADFQIWETSNWDVKPLGSKGYQTQPLLNVEN
jgi:hypothetical protein